jgi:hypothetical protein
VPAGLGVRHGIEFVNRFSVDAEIAFSRKARILERMKGRKKKKEKPVAANHRQ